MQLTAAGRGNLRGSLGDGTVATSHSQENGIFASALPCLPSPVFRGTWVCARAAESPQLMRELLGGDNQSLLMIPTAQVRDQKQRELLQFQAFRAISGLVPDCEIYQPAAPEPDIVVDCPEGKVGVELTEINPSGLEKRSNEGEQEFLADMAKRLYDETGLPLVNVFIDWTKSPRLSKNRRQAATRLLCDLVMRNRPEGEEFSGDVGDGDTLIHPDLPIRGISISWASSPEGSDWRD
jgi:hypothetical protein